MQTCWSYTENDPSLLRPCWWLELHISKFVEDKSTLQQQQQQQKHDGVWLLRGKERGPSFSDSEMETRRWDVKNSFTFKFSAKRRDESFGSDLLSSCDRPGSFLAIHVVETGNKTVAKSLRAYRCSRATSLGRIYVMSPRAELCDKRWKTNKRLQNSLIHNHIEQMHI